MTTMSLSAETIYRALAPLDRAAAEVARAYPGDRVGRQPVHTVYGGAHLFRADTARKLGAVALRALDEYAPDAATFATVFGLGPEAETIRARVVDKLTREPVEDLRIDFEDGYGVRPDAEEDAHAVAAAGEVVKGMAAKTLPPFLGIRIKPLDPELRARSVRTLDLFLTTLVAKTEGRVLPEGFVVTLPKITTPEQVRALADVLDAIEPLLDIAPGTIGIELMIETTQSMFSASGEVALVSLLESARGRCRAAHFGAYDYTANCNIIAAHQRLTHPACDFARHLMQVAYARTGIWLSDGATNVLPVARHRAAPGAALSQAQVLENREVVQGAFRLHYDNVRHALVHGFYQGWDLHPAQLPVRYAAIYAFFLEGLALATDRLKNFVEQAARATRVGEMFDDAATGQGLLNVFLMAVSSGAITEGEAASATGLSVTELRSRSFAKILDNRRVTPAV